MNNLVSVIIPCFNQEAYIEDTIKSIIGQTYVNWEAIIIDDGSTDKSKEIILKWTSQYTNIKYFYKQNGGLPDARNCGLNLAKGTFIQFLDSDDLLDPEKLNVQIRALTCQPEADISVSKALYFNDVNFASKFEIDYNLDKLPKLPTTQELLELLIKGNRFPVSAPLIRASVLKTLNGFDRNLTSLEDWDFWIRLALNDAKFIIETNSSALTYIRVHENSMSKDNFKMAFNRVLVYEKCINNVKVSQYFSIQSLRELRNDSIKSCIYLTAANNFSNKNFELLDIKFANSFRYKLFKLFTGGIEKRKTRIIWIFYELCTVRYWIATIKKKADIWKFALSQSK